MIVVTKRSGVSCRKTSPLRASVQKHLEKIMVSGDNILNGSDDGGTLAGIWINQFHAHSQSENHDVIRIWALEDDDVWVVQFLQAAGESAGVRAGRHHFKGVHIHRNRRTRMRLH